MGFKKQDVRCQLDWRRGVNRSCFRSASPRGVGKILNRGNQVIKYRWLMTDGEKITTFPEVGIDTQFWPLPAF
jgi:hypothetical protein